MNEQTRILIESLATKLGTTAEHLWGVLVRQAPISSAVDTAVMVFMFLALAAGFHAVRKNTRKDGRWEGLATEARIVWTVVATLLAVTCLCALETTVAGFMNPEYWALMRILRK